MGSPHALPIMFEKAASESVTVAKKPTEVAQFKDDPRISFDRTKDMYILEDERGQEFEYNARYKTWYEVPDEALLEQQASIYKVPGVEDSVPADEPKKRKAEDDEEIDPVSGRTVKKAKQKPEAQKKERVNTAVYVTNLPEDCTLQEIAFEFGHLCGVIATSLDDDQPRITMYRDSDGNFTGEALIVFHRADSIQNAINFFNGRNFRLGAPHPRGVMSVTKATSKPKTEIAEQKELAGEQKPKKKAPMSKAEKQKQLKHIEAKNALVDDWSEDEQIVSFAPQPPAKTVVFKHMFTLKELAEDTNAAEEVLDFIKEECAKIGNVTKAVLYDLEADGIVTVKFEEESEARAAVQAFAGRSFEGVKVEAYATAGKPKFKKAKISAEEQERRLEAYSKELEEQDD